MVASAQNCDIKRERSDLFLDVNLEVAVRVLNLVACSFACCLVLTWLSAAVTQGVGTLEKAFERYLEAEKLEGKNAFMCQKCVSKQTALKGLQSFGFGIA